MLTNLVRELDLVVIVYFLGSFFFGAILSSPRLVFFLSISLFFSRADGGDIYVNRGC